jgi:hypothetical protein
MAVASGRYQTACQSTTLAEVVEATRGGGAILFYYLSGKLEFVKSHLFNAHRLGV